MSADAWETCPLCHKENAVREDYDIGLDEEGAVYIYFKAVCQGCGAKWEIDRIILCKR